ncbi:MAG: hypothetical protein BJ554DRAFT_3227 [Olpidium bornovanus]|uniref:Peptidase M16 C-terminal domain-containing protein n=1 Tax=Olpidium bornovanus TaxID=278681 RepID=A0A8H7ZNS3_9FUNG|nr:MAG: hypothetical protein BJ554DRAFT_3227 [Olpidium bornovanus]
MARLRCSKFFLELLRDVAYLTQYNLHEAEFVKDVISQEAARASKCPDAVVCGALHKTAFRAGLGNSLYTQPVRVTPDDVAAFAARTKGEVAVAAAGVGSAEVQQSVQDAFGAGFAELRERLREKAGSRLANRLEPPSAPAKLQASKYFGGEDRIDASVDDGHLAVAYPTGAFIGSQTEAVAQILKAHLDNGAPVSYAPSVSALAKVAAKTGADIKAFNFAYSDSGILGVRVRCPEDRAGDAVKGAVAEIKRAAESFSDEELKIAATRAKVVALQAFQSKVSLVEYMGLRTLAGSQGTGVAGLIANLDSVKSADVSKVRQIMIPCAVVRFPSAPVSALPY